MTISFVTPSKDFDYRPLLFGPNSGLVQSNEQADCVDERQLNSEVAIYLSVAATVISLPAAAVSLATLVKMIREAQTSRTRLALPDGRKIPERKLIVITIDGVEYDVTNLSMEELANLLR